MAGSFFDTNVLLYVVSTDPAKADRAERLMLAGGIISVQVLNELANVARRKMRLSWTETHILLNAVRGLLSVHSITTELHDAGLVVAERYGLSIYDAMIVAAALHADCDKLWSEGMHNGLLVDSRVRITNPFCDAT
jgi:predicted nucleic acid-binding protein